MGRDDAGEVVANTGFFAFQFQGLAVGVGYQIRYVCRAVAERGGIPLRPGGRRSGGHLPASGAGYPDRHALTSSLNRSS